MVDDDHDSTLCQVIGKCKPYPDYPMWVISITVYKVVATEVYDKSK